MPLKSINQSDLPSQKIVAVSSANPQFPLDKTP